MSAPLTDTERAIILGPCECGHTLNDHGGLAGCWVCSEESDEWCLVECETLMIERIERIVFRRMAAALAAEQRLTAVRAALELIHTEREFFHPGGSQVMCRACSDDWPCATLRALADPTTGGDT